MVNWLLHSILDTTPTLKTNEYFQRSTAIQHFGMAENKSCLCCSNFEVRIAAMLVLLSVTETYGTGVFSHDTTRRFRKNLTSIKSYWRTHRHPVYITNTIN
jgi:hypothetical protein